MANFPRTATDTVALVGDSTAVSRGLRRGLFETPTWAIERIDTFDSGLGAYANVSGLSTVGGELVGTLGMWADMYLETGYIVGMPAESQFDFWVPAYSDTADTFYAYEVDMDGAYVYLDNDPDPTVPGSWRVYPPAGTALADYAFIPDPSTWYTIRAAYENHAANSAYAIKVWKRGDPEPSAWTMVWVRATPGFPYDNNYIATEASGTGAVEPGKMDNLILRGGGGVTDVPFVPVFRTKRVFNIGGAGTIRRHRIFDIEGVPARADTRRRFNIEGTVHASSVRRFDIEGALRVSTVRTFDIVSASTEMDPETDLGTWVNPSSVGTTTLSAPAAAGDTTITVVAAFGAPGTLLQIGTEYVAIAEVLSPTSILLAAPLSAGVASGTTISTARGFIPGIHVFTKAGVPIGVLSKYTLSTAPTMMIGNMGSAGFHISRLNPQAHLIEPDRLIAFTFRVGSAEMWAGNIEVDDNSASVINVMAPDVFSLLTGAPILVKQDVSDSLVAGAVYRAVVDATNVQKQTDGEILWSVDDTGVTNLFYGSIDFDGDPLDAIEDIATRSDTEYRWVATLASDGRLQLTLLVRDEITVAGGVDIFDGPGGNIASNPRWIRDSAPIRNGLRLSGIASRISDYLPDWAHWAVEDVTPEVTVYVDPGDHRRRVDRTMSVGFGFSPTVLKAIADSIVEQLWYMYRTFLYGYHDQYGRPYHQGWGYEGPPSDIEPFLHTGIGWRTRRRLVELAGQPASVVMYSEPEKQVLAVTYDRVLAEYKARRYWASEQAGDLMVLVMEVHGRIRRWAGEGGYLTEYTGQGGGDAVHGSTTHDHAHSIVSTYVATMPHRYTDKEGNQKQDWHTVRRQTSLSEDGTLREGVYYEMAIYPFDANWPGCIHPGRENEPPHISLFLVTPEEAQSVYKTGAGTGITFDSAYITKMYEAERGHIRNWDPRRDGVGVFMSKPSIYNNVPTTRTRWFLQPFGVGVEGTTSLTTGVGPADTKLYVDSVFSLPTLGSDWDGLMEVGLDPVNEFVKVTSILGNVLTVQRAQNGTPAIIHETGTGVKAMNVKETSAFEHLWANLDWAEGRAWAERMLAKMNKPFIRVSTDLNNRNATWSSVRLGSLHPVTISTEGAEPLIGEVRVIGMSPDALTGRMEVILEWRQ